MLILMNIHLNATIFNCIDRFTFSGQSDELTDEDYNNNYDDYGSSKESSKENIPVTEAIDTSSVVQSTETLVHSTNQESELTTLPTVEVTSSTETITKVIEPSTTEGKPLIE